MWASKLTIVKALFLLNPWKLNTNCAGDDFRRDIDICLLANWLIFCLDFRSIPDLEHSDMSPSGIGGVSWSSRLPLRSRRRTYIGSFSNRHVIYIVDVPQNRGGLFLRRSLTVQVVWILPISSVLESVPGSPSLVKQSVCWLSWRFWSDSVPEPGSGHIFHGRRRH